MIQKLIQMNEILLHLLDELPEEEAKVLRDELASLYTVLVSRLEAAQVTSASYEIVASKIRAKASVQKRRLASRMKSGLFLEAG
jgi:flagellin-specific chaperone FliS